MININLLDWRAKRMKINNNIFFVITGVASLTCILVSAIFVLLFVQFAGNKQGNIDYLNRQIQEVESKIAKIKGLQQQKDLLLDRRKIIEGLQASRPLVVRIFDNLARAVPDGVTLTSLGRTKDVITLVGTSNSNANISEFMKNIQGLKWVKSAELNEIKAAVQPKKNTSAADGSNSAQAMTSTSADDSNGITFELKVSIDPKLTGGEANEIK